MLHAEDIINALPDEVYNKSPHSRVKILLEALLKSTNAFELRTVQTYLDQFLKTARFDALDKNFGIIFKIPRLPAEKYDYRPLKDALLPEEWAEIDAKDGRYRNRLMKFVEAAVTGGVAGIKLACEAAIGYSCHIQERFHLGNGFKDPSGINEFVIIPYKNNFTQEDALRIKLVVDRLKPITTLYTIRPTVESIKEIPILDITASSEYHQVNVQKDFYTRIAEYDTENKVTGLANISSELIQEEVYKTPGQYIVKPNMIDNVSASGAPNVKRNLLFHSSSVDCWYGWNASIHGHKGSDALGGNLDSYWLSVGNGSPTDVYSFEWIQVQINESGEGRGINKVRFYTPYANMSLWISIQGDDGQWWDFGGAPIPYDPNHTAAYPNGANIPWVVYVADTGDAGWCEVDLGHWFHNAKYVRFTFHNLYNSGIGPYVYRAAVSEIECWADISEYYNPQRAIQYDNDITWISQVSSSENPEGSIWFRANFSGRQRVNRIKIMRGNRAPDQQIQIYDDQNNLVTTVNLKSKVVTISFDPITTKYLKLVWTKCNIMSILSNYYGAEVCQIEIWYEEYQEGERVITYKKPHPGKNICDGNPSTWWSSNQHIGPGDAMEYAELYTYVDSEINRIQVWTHDKGMNIMAKYWDETASQWRYCAQQANCDYVTILEFDLITTSAIRIEFTSLARQSNGMFAAVVKEITAWARLEEAEDFSSFSENSVYKWGADKAIDGSYNTFWRSKGVPDAQGVEFINLSIPASGDAVAGIMIDPETPGCTVSIYSSNDNEVWVPIHKDYYLSNEIMWFPEPIKAKYFKIEFSKLQPRGYVYTIKETYEVEKYILKDAEQQRLGGLKYARFLDKGEHTYDVKKITATRPVANYVGIREIKLYQLVGQGIDWHNFCDYFNDTHYVNFSACPSGSNALYWNNESMMTSAGVVNNCLAMSGLDLVHDLKAIGLNVDEYVPSGGNSTWQVSRNGGITWHDVTDIINEENKYFVFPDTDSKPWDQFRLRVLIRNYHPTEQYVLNQYCLEFYYYILL